MVKTIHIYLLFAYILMSGLLMASEPSVSTEVDAYGLYENNPINVMIMVSHATDQKIDAKSFKLKGEEIKADFVKDVEISKNPSIILTVYRFKLDPQPQGLHLLPEVSVIVAGKKIQSIARTYMISPAPEQPATPDPVQQPQTAQPVQAQPQQPTQPVPASASPLPESDNEQNKKIVLKLEASIDPNKPVYPGQKLTFIYKYLFNGNIDLSKEEIPMLEAEGFKKIGEKEFNDTQVKDMTIHQVSQKVEAVKPGDYSFGPSVIEGYNTVTGADGKGRRVLPLLHSEAPIITVKVAPFPEQGKPTSFNGAIGKFSFKAELQGPSKVAVGDTITLVLTFTGSGDLDNLPMPEVCCQPGFSGIFKTSDLPPVGVVKDKSKIFSVTMQPLSPSIKEIPQIEFSSFDPAASTYIVEKSKPISLQVAPLPKTEAKPDNALPLEKKNEPVEIPAKTKAIEIQGAYRLDSSNLSNLLFGTWKWLWIIPVSIFLIILQLLIKKTFREQAIEQKKLNAKKLMEMADINREDPSLFYYYLNEAFITRLFEIKEITTPDLAIENLPDTGFSKEIKDFWAEIDAQRFSGKAELSVDETFVKAQDIFIRMKKEFKIDG